MKYSFSDLQKALDNVNVILEEFKRETMTCFFSHDYEYYDLKIFGNDKTKTIRSFSKRVCKHCGYKEKLKGVGFNRWDCLLDEWVEDLGDNIITDDFGRISYIKEKKEKELWNNEVIK